MGRDPSNRMTQHLCFKGENEEATRKRQLAQDSQQVWYNPGLKGRSSSYRLVAVLFHDTEILGLHVFSCEVGCLYQQFLRSECASAHIGLPVASVLPTILCSSGFRFKVQAVEEANTNKREQKILIWNIGGHAGVPLKGKDSILLWASYPFY